MRRKAREIQHAGHRLLGRLQHHDIERIVLSVRSRKS